MKFTLLLLFSIILITSCQKGLDTGEPPVNSLIDTIRVKEILKLMEEPASPGIDTTETFELFYDNLFRHVSTTHYIRPWGSIIDTHFTNNYYIGTDTLPFKRTDLVTSLNNYSEIFYWYDAAGKVIKDSARNSNRIVVTWDENIPGGLRHISKTIINQGGAVTQDTSMIYQTIVNGNIVHEEGHNTQSGPFSVDVIFDNKPNAFKRLMLTHDHHFRGSHLSLGTNNQVSYLDHQALRTNQYTYFPNGNLKSTTSSLDGVFWWTELYAY